MQKVKNARLRKKCQESLSDDNLELCLQEISFWYSDNEEIINQRGRVSALNKEEIQGTISPDEYRRERSRIRVALSAFVNENILPYEDDTILEGVHNRILIFSPESKIPEWRAMFSEKNFSHACIISYDDAVPAHYRSPDVVIFDDSGPNARPYIVQCAETMPQAHFLYYGDLNPFTESRKRNEKDAAIYDRCANANSKFTVHARLQELLEFRRKYGVPGDF